MDIDEEIKRLQMLRDQFGGDAQAPEASGTGSPEAVPQETKQATEEGSLEFDNGYYQLMEARVVKIGAAKTFNSQKGTSTKKTITFAYKAKKAENESLIACEAWNETLDHNDFQLGAYYDITLRVGCRTTQTGEDFPTVTLVYAHRLRSVKMV